MCDIHNFQKDFFQVKTTKTNSIKMAFEHRFNAIRFYSKLNHFVLSPRKKPNHFVLKIRPGGFADYTNTLFPAGK